MSLPMPNAVPEQGFYYHYKHDPSVDVTNYAYEVVGVGFHTEDDAREGEAHFLIYRPLYQAAVYTASKELGLPCFDNRPLDMWMSTVEKDGETISRFKKIVDLDIIKELVSVRDAMYC